MYSCTLSFPGGNKRLIDYKSGKSHLIPLLQENLQQALENQNLEVTVGIRGDVKPIGSSSAPWDDCFKEMVQVSHEEFVTPASISDNFCLMESGVIKGNVQLFLRLSCFGKSIQTQFEVLHEGGKSQFLFKTPNMATTFVCSKWVVSTSNKSINSKSTILFQIRCWNFHRLPTYRTSVQCCRLHQKRGQSGKRRAHIGLLDSCHGGKIQLHVWQAEFPPIGVSLPGVSEHSTSCERFGHNFRYSLFASQTWGG